MHTRTHESYRRRLFLMCANNTHLFNYEQFMMIYMAMKFMMITKNQLMKGELYSRTEFKQSFIELFLLHNLVLCFFEKLPYRPINRLKFTDFLNVDFFVLFSEKVWWQKVHSSFNYFFVEIKKSSFAKITV
jgi:ammonia channel protein AmtB